MRFQVGEIVQHRDGLGRVLEIDPEPPAVVFLEWIHEHGYASWVLDIECRPVHPLRQLAEQSE